LTRNFKAETSIELQWVVVDIGKELDLGKNCNVDVVLVHASASEIEHVKGGYGVDRKHMMFSLQ